MLEAADELASALRGAMNSPTLTIIDCPVDASENLRLTQRLDMLGCQLKRTHKNTGENKKWFGNDSNKWEAFEKHTFLRKPGFWEEKFLTLLKLVVFKGSNVSSNVSSPSSFFQSCDTLRPKGGVTLWSTETFIFLNSI